MKVFTIIAKIVVALAAIAGIVYIAATYGDKIVAWCKKLLGCCCTCDCDCECDCDCTCEECDCEVIEEAPAEEVVEQPAAEEAPAASEEDFEG